MKIYDLWFYYSLDSHLTYRKFLDLVASYAGFPLISIYTHDEFDNIEKYDENALQKFSDMKCRDLEVMDSYDPFDDIHHNILYNF